MGSAHTVKVLTDLERGGSSSWFSRATSRYSDGVSSRKGTQHIGQHLASVRGSGFLSDTGGSGFLGSGSLSDTGASGFLSDMGGKSKSDTYDEQNPVGQSPTHQEPH